MPRRQGSETRHLPLARHPVEAERGHGSGEALSAPEPGRNPASPIHSNRETAPMRTDTPDNSGCRARRQCTQRQAFFLLAAPAVTLALTPLLWWLRVSGEVVAFLWLLAIACTVIASLVQAVLQGIRHGNGAAFDHGHDAGREEDFDYVTRTGEFAWLRIRADNEALVREDERFAHAHDRLHPL